MVSRHVRKKFGSHNFKSLGRPTNLTPQMELDINRDIDNGVSNYKLLQKYPIGLKTLRQIREKRIFFSDYP